MAICQKALVGLKQVKNQATIRKIWARFVDMFNKLLTSR